MKRDIRWILIAGIGLVTISLSLFTLHYMLFHDTHHLFIFFVGDMAFIPIEVLIVTLIIDQLLESREKQQREEKMNMIIGTFFSNIGTPLLATLCRADSRIARLKPRLLINEAWEKDGFSDVRACLGRYRGQISLGHLDIDALRHFLAGHEDFLLRLVENPMISEHESFTDLVLALIHLTEELKARGDLSSLPEADQGHLSGDVQRVYSWLIPEWLRYMEYLKTVYPYLFSLAIRKNPFDDAASVVIREPR
jgi:hypothetical protein